MLMNEECRNQITSNDFADFLIDYSDNIETIPKAFEGGCINVINKENAVVHLPVSRITRNSINEFGYASFPSCYSLTDDSSLEAIGVSRIQNMPDFALRGQGTIIGIVDTGIDYKNPIFQNTDKTSRIISIWDQTIDSANYPKEFFFGTVYTREQINTALANENPLSIVPSIDENGHGTNLAGIAAGGRDDKNNFVGVAPEAEIIVVKLKQAKPYLRDFFAIPQDAVCYQENDIMFGINYLLNTSRELKKPIAICVGLGTSQGGHDGRGTLSSMLSDESDNTGTAFAVAAGNEGNSGHHYYGEIDKTSGFDTVEIRVAENVKGFTFEIWGYSPSKYSIDILSPTGEYIPRIPPRIGETRDIGFIFEKTKINVDYSLIESQTGDELILVRMLQPTAGIWKFKVYGTGELTRGFHCWLPMTAFLSTDTYFVKSNPNTTIVSPGNSTGSFTLTAYNHRTQSLYLNAGRGYSRLDQIKPDLAAPGVEISVPVLNNTFEVKSGTSISAAYATGVMALMLEWGIVKNNNPYIDGYEIKKYLIRGARRTTSNFYPNQEWGYGILDIYNTFENLRRDVQSPSGTQLNS